MPAERTDEEIARDALIEVPDYWSINAQGFVHIVERACKEARAQGVAEGIERAAKVAEQFKGSDGLRDTYPDTARQINAVSMVRREARCIAAAIRSLSPAPKDEGE